MLNDVLRLINKRRTPQGVQARSDQVRNSAGGWTFELDDAARLRRFLILGTDGGTFYASPLALTLDNAAVVERMCVDDPGTLLDLVHEVSVGGLAPKPNPALFALAVAASFADDEHRARALRMLPEIARTGTHLFLFATYIEQFRGWGRGLRRAVANWYLERDVTTLAYQLVKYRQRDGWTHRDLLRLAHPDTGDPVRRALFEWVVRRTDVPEVPELSLIRGFTEAQRAETSVVELVAEHGLSWEMLPDTALTQPEVWDALLAQGMPMTALLRQLGRLTSLGVLAPGSRNLSAVVAQLTDAERIRKARVHPLQVLIALRTYASGHGLRGSLTWRPVQQLIDALDEMFLLSFTALVPTGKRMLLAVDVSGSMDYWSIAGTPLTPRVAAAAMAMVTATTESDYEVVGFSHKLVRLPISPRQRLDDVVKTMSGIPFGATDCAKPMEYALARGREVDAFVIYTDNETWSGRTHPHQALRAYRDATGIPAKLVVVGMTSTRFSIADPDDAGMLDVVGFDASAPAVMADFIRG
ncbi:TROVE domain-containing protein [Ammonicoccus fulvus]|uniref:TROVE domain-containing protein n=1 Tax=Ammonicoccus fulvus TaxID=3138240 RepID=A0ABZ3FRL4_9ACTN